jgi:hypothetical protein
MNTQTFRELTETIARRTLTAMALDFDSKPESTAVTILTTCHKRLR